MISEAESGGNVANLIDRIVDNLKETKTLKEEMSASAIAYHFYIDDCCCYILAAFCAFISSSFNLYRVHRKIATSSRLQPIRFHSQKQTWIQGISDFSVITIGAISFASMIVAIVEKET